MTTTSTNPHKPAARPPKILVVDDNPIIVKTLTLKLNSSGYDTIAAQDGSEAVAAARKEKPDLILLDVNFPSDVSGPAWDGFRIIDWLRRVDEARVIPIIIISSGDPVKLRPRALDAGAIAFFEKPINNDELLEVIRKAVAGGDSQPGAATIA